METISDVLRFQLVGPKANAILHATLALKESNEEKVKMWQGLTSMRSCGSLPAGAVIGLTVKNPRLHFPPPKASTIGTITADQQHIVDKNLSILSAWTEQFASSPLWNKEKRATIVDKGQTRKCKEDIDVCGKLVSNHTLDWCSAAPFTHRNAARIWNRMGCDITCPVGYTILDQLCVCRSKSNWYISYLLPHFTHFSRT